MSITFNIFRFFYRYALKLNTLSISLIYYIINIVQYFLITNADYYAIIAFTFFMKFLLGNYILTSLLYLYLVLLF